MGPLGAQPRYVSGLWAAVAWWWPDQWRLPKVVAVPAYVVVGNLAALHASLRAVGGALHPVWEPTRRKPGGRW